METSTKKELSDALKYALKDEHLWTHQAATLLNLNPQYISMMLNPNSFDKCGITVWSRVEDWFKTKDSLSNYKFPADEPVWKPKEKAEDKDYNIQAPTKAKGVPKMKDPPPPPEKKQKTEIKPVSKELVEAVIENLQKEEDKKMVHELIPTMYDKRIEELLAENEELREAIRRKPIPNLTETLEPAVISQKMALDIEINLLINGQRIKLN
jgi:hypothetical protein